MPSNQYPLLFIGQPLLDISAVIDEGLLKKYGLEANNMILAADEHRPLYKELEDHFPSYLAGGSEANTARGAQWLLPAGSTGYIGCVGNDSGAEKLKEAAAADGLAAHYITEPELPTGKCAVLISGHNRSMVTDLQASAALKESHLRNEKIWQLVEGSKIIYSSAFCLKDSLDALLAVAKHASLTEKTFAFNLSAPWIPEVCRSQLASVLPYCDFLFGNESEARAYAKANDLKTTDVAEIALHLASLPRINPTRPSRIVVITQGSDPVVVATKDGVREYQVPKIPVEQIVDTNGAGDGFCGGFLAALLLNKSLGKCVRAGLMVAGEVLKQQGGSYPRHRPTYMPWGEWWSGEGPACCILQ